MSTSKWDSGIYVQDILNTTTVTSYIMIYEFVYRNGPTNIRKSVKGFSIPYRAPFLSLGRVRGVTVVFRIDR